MRSFGKLAFILGTLGIVLLASSGLERATPRISIKDMKFDPANVNVKVGDTVRWENDDDRDHTVTAEDGSFKSGNLRNGDSFQHKFDKAGKFAYSCSYHPRMKGSVNVSSK
jgi:plastocyanin